MSQGLSVSCILLSMDALLIIDMQKLSFCKTPRLATNVTVENINALSAWFRRTGKPVIFIQHDGTKEGYLERGSEGWEILPELTRGENDLYVDKDANDSFYRSELDAVLKARGVDRLFTAGCATDFCVNATIHSALVRDYDVVVARGCHTTADRPMIDAARLIEFHEWLWSNLTPTKGRVIVQTLAEIMRE